MEPIYVIAKDYDQFRVYVKEFNNPDKFVYLQWREQVCGLRYIEVVSLMSPNTTPRWLMDELHIRNLPIRYDNCDEYDHNRAMGVRVTAHNPVLLLCGI